MRDLTVAKLEKEAGIIADETTLAIAKHAVMGLSGTDIADVMGLTEAELGEIQATEIFQRVRKYVAAQYLENGINRDAGWDSLEDTALANLHHTMKFNKDPDLNLRVAAVANKAIRRQRELREDALGVRNGARVELTLTQRFVKAIEGGQPMIEPNQRQLRQANPVDVVQFLGKEETEKTFVVRADHSLNTLVRKLFAQEA